ncbi:MAG: hypothetical protein WBF34_12825 [Streptosporangiaceae bacterium]
MSNATRFRVIFHPPLCPACGGTDIEDQDVDTGDGMTETAHVCRECGQAWPVACICDWDTPPPCRGCARRSAGRDQRGCGRGG